MLRDVKKAILYIKLVNRDIKIWSYILLKVVLELHRAVLKSFYGRAHFLFVKALGAESFSYSTEAPNMEKEPKGKK